MLIWSANNRKCFKSNYTSSNLLIYFQFCLFDLKLKFCILVRNYTLTSSCKSIRFQPLCRNHDGDSFLGCWPFSGIEGKMQRLRARVSRFPLPPAHEGIIRDWFCLQNLEIYSNSRRVSTVWLSWFDYLGSDEDLANQSKKNLMLVKF